MWAAIASKFLGGGGGGGGGMSAGDSRETSFGDQEFSTGQRFAIGGNPNLALLESGGAAGVLSGNNSTLMLVAGIAGVIGIIFLVKK